MWWELAIVIGTLAVAAIAVARRIARLVDPAPGCACLAPCASVPRRGKAGSDAAR